MNQVARLALPSSPSVTGTARPAKGGRSLIHINDADPIDALNPQPGISYNDAALAYEDEGSGTSGRKNRFSQPSASNFNAPSQSFAAMFEGTYDSQSSATRSGSNPRFMNILLSKAIGIYETNARIISGSEKSIGSSLSLTL